MKIVWHTAMPTVFAVASTATKWKMPSSRRNTSSQKIVPMILMETCTTATRFAFRLTPIAERIAVIQVPMLQPMMMGIATP